MLVTLKVDHPELSANVELSFEVETKTSQIEFIDEFRHILVQFAGPSRYKEGISAIFRLKDAVRDPRDLPVKPTRFRPQKSSSGVTMFHIASNCRATSVEKVPSLVERVRPRLQELTRPAANAARAVSNLWRRTGLRSRRSASSSAVAPAPGGAPLPQRLGRSQGFSVVVVGPEIAGHQQQQEEDEPFEEEEEEQHQQQQLALPSRMDEEGSPSPCSLAQQRLQYCSAASRTVEE